MSLLNYISCKIEKLSSNDNPTLIKFINILNEPDNTIINQINKIRKQIYVEELNQYTNYNITEPGELFIVCFDSKTMNVIGYVSITSPDKIFRLEQFVESNTLRNILKDCEDITNTYEIRSLTILPEYRGGILYILLCIFAIKWIIMNGGTDIIGIAAEYLVPSYKKLNCKIYEKCNIKIGNIVYYPLSNTYLTSHYKTKYSLIEKIFKKKLKYLDYSFFDNMDNTNDLCYHGGSSWEISGLNFKKRKTLVVADVLDSYFKPSPNVINIINTNLTRSIMESPPTHSDQLIETISNVRNISKDKILVSSGSSSIMYSIFPNILTKKSRVLLLSPMYGEYKHIMENVIKCNIDYFYLHKKDNYKIDLEKLDSIVDNYDLLIIVNPNSPTGVYCDLVDIIKKKKHKNIKIWVDETYIDYLYNKTLEPLLEECKNLYICKSMSKCYALSGLRVAYLAGNVENFKKYIPPWSVSLPAQLAAIEALKDIDYYSGMYKNVHENRINMENNLIEANFEAFKGSANFFLVFLKNYSNSEFLERCRQLGVFLRDVTNMGIESNCIRIAVKTPEENIKIIKTIKIVHSQLTTL